MELSIQERGGVVNTRKGWSCQYNKGVELSIKKGVELPIQNLQILIIAIQGLEGRVNGVIETALYAQFTC